eukprot:1136660-Amorphochlora_amoeboformis.AAC.2
MGAVRDQPVLAWVPSRQNRSQLWNRGTVLGGMLCILAATVVISSREYSKTQENSLSWFVPPRVPLVPSLSVAVWYELLVSVQVSSEVAVRCCI